MLKNNIRTIGLLCCNEQRAIAEVTNFSFSFWLSKANESNRKRSIISAQHASEKVPKPTDNNWSIKKASAHCEQKTHLFYTNFDELQSRITNLKSVGNLKKNLIVIQVGLKNKVLVICCLILKLFQRTVWLLRQKYTNSCYWKFMKHKSLTRVPYKT